MRGRGQRGRWPNEGTACAAPEPWRTGPSWRRRRARPGTGGEGLGDLSLDGFSLAESAVQFAEDAQPAAEAAPGKACSARAGRAAAGTGGSAAARAGRRRGGGRAHPGAVRSPEENPRVSPAQPQDRRAGPHRRRRGDRARPVEARRPSWWRARAAQEIAALAGRITGKRIGIPRVREEDRRRLRGGAAHLRLRLPGEHPPAGAACSPSPSLRAPCFGFLGYRYVYRPLSALRELPRRLHADPRRPLHPGQRALRAAPAGVAR